MSCSGRAVPARSLASKARRKQHADHEPLRTVVEVVDVDHRDLVVERDRVLVGPGDVGSDEVAEVAGGAVQATKERVGRAAGDGAPGPRPELAVGREHTVADDVDELVELAHDRAVERDRAAHRIAVSRARLVATRR